MSGKRLTSDTSLVWLEASRSPKGREGLEKNRCRSTEVRKKGYRYKRQSFLQSVFVVLRFVVSCNTNI
eukprot:1569119-Amphidinium_carterae.1